MACFAFVAILVVVIVFVVIIAIVVAEKWQQFAKLEINEMQLWQTFICLWFLRFPFEANFMLLICCRKLDKICLHTFKCHGAVERGRCSEGSSYCLYACWHKCPLIWPSSALIYDEHPSKWSRSFRQIYDVSIILLIRPGLPPNWSSAVDWICSHSLDTKHWYMPGSSFCTFLMIKRAGSVSI